jgi:phage/plasmid primase-like uncharacterized protein
MSEDGAVSSFFSKDFLWERYNDAKSKGPIDTTKRDERSTDRMEREHARQRDAIAKIEVNQKAKETALDNAFSEWSGLTPSKGDNQYFERKNVSDAGQYVELKQGAFGDNPFDAYQLKDMKGDFAGIQRLFEQKLLDHDTQEETTNKLWNTGIAFKDPKTDNPLAIHGTVGDRFADVKAPLFFTEGLADAITVTKAMQSQTVIGQTKANLGWVISAYRERYPNRDLVWVADNDMFRKRGDGNVGVLAAIDAAYSNQITFVIPTFDGLDLSIKPTDINDLSLLASDDIVKTQLANRIAPPATLMEYHLMRVQYLGPDNYEQGIQRAVEAVSTENPQLDAANIEAQLLQVTNVFNAAEVPVEKKPEPVRQVINDQPSEWPVKVTVEKNAKNRPYLKIVDTSEGQIYAPRIQKVVTQVMRGKEASYYPSLKGYAAPVQFVNSIKSKLHDLTGAQQLYIGKRYQGGDGFVLRGNIDDAAVLEQIDTEIGGITHYYDEAEMGVIE